MKILLVAPPIEDFYDTSIRLQPIGLCYLKAALNLYCPQTQVLVVDGHRGFGKKSISLPLEFSYLREYYPFADLSPFCTFYHYYHFGASYESLALLAKKFKPDLVGISSLFSPYYREALATAKALKEATGALVVMGGGHVSAMPETVLQEPFVDFVIQGEGERPLVSLIQALSSCGPLDQVPNLGYKKEGQFYFNRLEDNFPLEQIPPPDVSDLNLKDYVFEGRPATFVISSRSCPHHCSFCSVHLVFGSNYRRNSVERVLDEIKNRYHQGYRVFDFEDDNLTFYKEPMKELCRQLINLFPQKDVRLVAMNGVSYLSLDSELLALMKQAGFTQVNLALVSSDQSVLHSTKRPHTVDKYVRVVQDCIRESLKVTSYQILGLPQESLESMSQTLIFNTRLPVLLGASPFYMTPHSPIAEQLNVPSSKSVAFMARLSTFGEWSSHAGREQIYTLFVATRIFNFLKGLPVVSDLSFKDLRCLEGLSQRQRLGLELLDDFLATGELKGSTQGQKKSLIKIDNLLLEDLWNKTDFVMVQNGSQIKL